MYEPILGRAASVEKGTIEEYTSWEPPVRRRSTIQLLITCILTLGLCVWTALHLNVPKAGSTQRQKMWRKFLWMVIGIFAPELVVYVAYTQRAASRKLRNQMHGLQSKRRNWPQSFVKEAKSYSEWSLVHSFFAVMGGIAFRTTDETDGSFVEGPSRYYCLTPQAVYVLAAHDLLPDIPKPQIDDKAKADFLAKSLVCIQAIWMLLQVIARLIDHLPVTLLEINTVGHVLCALMIYVLWWDKPLDVTDPILLPTDDRTTSFIALMWMYSSVSSSRTVLHPKPEIDCLEYHPRLTDGTRRTLSAASWVSFGDTCDRSQRSDLPSNVGNISQEPFTHKSGCEHWDDEATRIWKKSRYRNRDGVKPHVLPKDRTRTNRWNMASQAMDYMWDWAGMIPSHNRFSFRDEIISKLNGDYLLLRVSDWPGVEVSPGLNSDLFRLTLAMASAGYGGLHAAAWYSHFPSVTEKWLWVGSSLVIAASGFLVFFWYGIKALLGHLGWWKIRQRWLHLGDSARYVLISLGALYVFARLFIVVEAFISLRDVPISTYKTPAWAELFPHLG